MGAMFGTFFRIALQVLAGVGVGELLDKFVRPKTPAAYPEPIGIGFKPLKLLWVIVAFVSGIMILKFIGKKLNVKILK